MYIEMAPACVHAGEYGIFAQTEIPDYGDFYLARLPGYGTPVALVASGGELFMTAETTCGQPLSVEEIAHHEWYGLHSGKYAININGLPYTIK